MRCRPLLGLAMALACVTFSGCPKSPETARKGMSIEQAQPSEALATKTEEAAGLQATIVDLRGRELFANDKRALEKGLERLGHALLGSKSERWKAELREPEDLLKQFVGVMLMNGDLNTYDQSETLVKSSYFDHVVLCLPNSFPARNRHVGYYSKTKECSEQEKALAAISAAIDRNPDQLRKLYATFRTPLFALISPEAYEKKGFKKTTELLVATHQHFKQVPGFEMKLAASLQRMDQLLASSTPHPAYGYSWCDELDPVLMRSGGDSEDVTCWTASFWMRRYDEKNASAVLEILQDIKKHYGEALGDETQPDTKEEPLSPMSIVELRQGKAPGVRACPKDRVCVSRYDFAYLVYDSNREFYLIDPALDMAGNQGSRSRARRRIVAAIRAVLAKKPTKKPVLDCHLAAYLPSLSGFSDFVSVAVPAARKITLPAAVSPKKANALVAEGFARLDPSYSSEATNGYFKTEEVEAMTAETFATPRLLHGSMIQGGAKNGSIAEYALVYSPESRKVYVIDHAVFNGPASLLSKKSMKRRARALEKKVIELLVALEIDRVELAVPALCRMPRLSGIRDWVPVVEGG